MSRWCGLGLPEESLARPPVELAQQRGLPLVPDAGAHAAVVGAGQEEEQVQPLEARDALGEAFDQARLGDVALLRELGHVEVGVDQEQHVLAQGVVGVEAVEHAGPDPHAPRHVPAAAPLADVVEQHAEVERGRVLHLVEDVAEAGHAGSRREVVERFEALQGVLVHRVAVEEIVLDEKGDAGPLREEAAQEAGLVHGPDGVGHPPPPLEEADEGPARVARGPELPGRRSRGGP